MLFEFPDAADDHFKLIARHVEMLLTGANPFVGASDVPDQHHPTIGLLEL